MVENIRRTVLPEKVLSAVRNDHDCIKMHDGHDIYHALRVGYRAMQIARDEWGDERVTKLAGVAGLCHNADRIIQKMYGIKDIPEHEVQRLVEKWLEQWDDASPEEKKLVVEAVLAHDGKNSKGHSKVSIALMDGDRVVNLEADFIIRCGQHYHNIPTVDIQNFLSDPQATYKDPRSVLRDIYHALEWTDEKVRFVCGRALAGSLAMSGPSSFCNFCKG